MNLFEHVGRYAQLMSGVFSRPQRWTLLGRQYVREVEKQGLQSLGITIIISIFIGSAITMQMVLNTENPLLPKYVTGLTTRETLLLEFSSTILCLILAGKVGSNIASEIGTMRITEQIDALKLLKIDPIEYLVYPRFVANIISTCCLTLISIFVTLSFAIIYAVVVYNFSAAEYMNSLAPFLNLIDLVCAITKGIVFGGVMPIISCYYGLRCVGGAEGVGLATTNGVVLSTVVIIVLDFCITYLFSLVI